MSNPRSVLVVVTRRIGDVLLATPVMRSVKRAYPEAAVDALVFEGSGGFLAANPDLREVIAIPERPTRDDHLALWRKVRRRYDLAVSLVPSDRPVFYAFAAGRRRAGLVAPERRHFWKRWLLGTAVDFDNLDTHTVRMHLAVCEAAGIAPVPEVVVAWSAADEQAVSGAAPWLDEPFALLHVHPMFAYKTWTVEGWAQLARWLAERGIRPVLTGGGSPAELSYVEGLLPMLPPPAVSLAGKLTLPQVACLGSRARLYAGPDTAITHMAAALGLPTVALFGPSNPVKWGPWPRGWPADRNPWVRRGSQRAGNVALVQGEGDCVPCLLEGCDRHVNSLSDCLQGLPAARVIAACEALLADTAVAPPEDRRR